MACDRGPRADECAAGSRRCRREHSLTPLSNVHPIQCACSLHLAPILSLPLKNTLTKVRILEALQRSPATFRDGQQTLRAVCAPCALRAKGVRAKGQNRMENLLTDESSPVWVIRYMSTKEVDELIALCTQKLDRGENKYRALLLRATAAAKKGSFTQALEDYNALLRLNPGSTDILYSRGVALEKVGRIEEAIEEFTKVLQFEPEHVNAAYSRAACQNLKGEFEGAIDDYMRALKLEQSHAETPNGVRRQRSSGNLAKINAAAPESLLPKLAAEGTRTSPLGGGSPSGRGAAAAKSEGAPAKVTLKLSLADEHNILTVGGDGGTFGASHTPGGAGSGSAWGASHLIESPKKSGAKGSSRGGSPSNGASGMEGGVAGHVEPMGAEYWYGRGLASRRAQRYHAAIDEYGEAILQDPSHFRAHFDRAFSFDKIGLADRALEDYSLAIQINPTSANAYYNRGITHDKLMRYDEAVADFTLAISLDPSNADFYHNRGFACR